MPTGEDSQDGAMSYSCGATQLITTSCFFTSMHKTMLAIDTTTKNWASCQGVSNPCLWSSRRTFSSVRGEYRNACELVDACLARSFASSPSCTCLSSSFGLRRRENRNFAGPFIFERFHNHFCSHKTTCGCEAHLKRSCSVPLSAYTCLPASTQSQNSHSSGYS